MLRVIARMLIGIIRTRENDNRRLWRVGAALSRVLHPLKPGSGVRQRKRWSSQSVCARDAAGALIT